MKILLVALFFFVLANSQAQKTKTDLSKDQSSADRKEMLEAIKFKLQPSLKLKPKMVVKELWVKNGFAFFKGHAKNAEGKDIDFNKTDYKEANKEGMFDGDATVALLKKVSGKWKVLAWSIGATDVPYTCWWSEFKAPKDIFDYTENCN